MKIKSSIEITWSLILIVAVIDTGSSHNGVDTKDYCRSVGRVLGKCVPLQDCSMFSSWLKERPVLKQNVKTIVKYTCYFHLEKPKVCCPLEEIVDGTRYFNLVLQDHSSFSPSRQDRGHEDTFYFPEDDTIARLRKMELLPSLQDCGNTVKLSRHVGTFGAYPWIALLGYKDPLTGNWVHLCSGSIINSKYILTSAKCLSSYPITHIRVGEYDLLTKVDRGSPYFANSVYQEYSVEGLKPHQYFSHKSLKNNVGLLRIKGEIKFGTLVSPICLPLEKYSININVGSKLLVAGWGRLHFNSSGYRTLQEGLVKVTQTTECEEKSEDVVCIGGNARHALCLTDAGGGLMLPLRINLSDSNKPKVFLVGVFSSGPVQTQCHNNNNGENTEHRLVLSRSGIENVPKPGLYSKVHNYMNWILNTIKE